MRDSQQFVNRTVVILGVLFVFLIICLTIYGSRSNKFSLTQPVASYSPTLTNPEVPQNWLPPVAYQYAVAQIDNYLKTNNILVSTVSFGSRVVINGSIDYGFSLTFEPQNQTHSLTVAVYNSSGLISTAISIDGQPQNYAAALASPTGTQYNGFDTLVNLGLTALQAEELQTAFQKFAPTANTVTIDDSSIVRSGINPDSSSLVTNYKFLVSINSTTYNAEASCNGLTQTELFLMNSQTNKQIFDSGVISQS